MFFCRNISVVWRCKVWGYSTERCSWYRILNWGSLFWWQLRWWVFLKTWVMNILVASHMGRFLENLGKFHLYKYLVHIVEMGEATPVWCHMEDLREAPLLVLWDVGSRYGGSPPYKWCFFQLCMTCFAKICDNLLVEVGVFYQFRISFCVKRNIFNLINI